MAFRFTIRTGDKTILTPWYKEFTPMDAPTVANEIRMEYPDAEFEIDRQNVRPDKSLNEQSMIDLTNKLRTEAGWSDEEIKAGVKSP